MQVDFHVNSIILRLRPFYIIIILITTFESTHSSDLLHCIKEDRLSQQDSCSKKALVKKYFEDGSSLLNLSEYSRYGFSEEQLIIAQIAVGDIQYREYSNHKLAFSNFLSAYKNASALSEPILQCESLKKMIEMLIFQSDDNYSTEKWIEKHRALAYDSIEIMINNYLELSYDIQENSRNKRLLKVTKNKWNSLIEFFKRKNGFEHLSDILGLKSIYHELHENNLNLALKTYESAIEYSKYLNKAKSQRIRFRSYANMGNLFENNGQYDEAIIYYKKSLNHLEQNELAKNRARFLLWISNSYQKKSNIDSAYYYLIKHNEILEDVKLHEQSTAVKELEEKYQNEKLTNDLSQETIKRKQSYITSLSLGGLLTLSLIGLYSFRRINKLKQNNLQQQIKETEQQGQLTAINAQLDGEEQERKRVAATLHDGIASHLTAASFHLQTLSQQSDSTQAADKAAKLIVEAAERTRQLSHELYPPVLIRDGLQPALKALINSYNHEELSFHIENENLNSNIPPEQETKIYYIVVELLQNVIKHSQASTCHIKIANHEKILSLSVIDNGIGIKETDRLIGLGLNSIRARLENMSGRMVIQQNVPQGAQVNIQIPLT